MITMEMLGKVRRMHLRDKLSLHEISKRTGLARNTLRKWVRMPEDEVAPPRYQRELKPTKLSAFHATLEQALKADALCNKQNRRTGKALFAQIKADGYPGSYSRVTDFIRDWCGSEGKAPHAFVPLTFELGEAFQFDWSEEGLVIGGIYRRMQVSHLKLCASRAFWWIGSRIIATSSKRATNPTASSTAAWQPGRASRPASRSARPVTAQIRTNHSDLARWLERLKK